MFPSSWQQRHTAAPLQQAQQIRAGPGLSSSRSSLQGLKLAFKQPAVQQVQRCSSKSRQQHAQALCCSSVGTAAASVCSCAGIQSSRGSFCRSRHCSSNSCSSQQSALPHQQQQPQILKTRQQRSAHVVRAASQSPPDPWQQPPGSGGATTRDWGSSGSSSRGPPGGIPPPPLPPNGNGRQSPLGSFDAWDAAAPGTPTNGMPRYEQTDWGWTGTPEDWDPAEGLDRQQLADMERDYLEQLQRRRQSEGPPRDKWITPLLDWQSILGAFDPDQSRTEDDMADEALTNKEESREALAFIGRLIVIPLITGALISRAITEPVLSFSLQNNPNAFQLTEHQKLEGAQALHMEETRVKMMMAIGQIPPMNEAGMLHHLHEFAIEFQEEEREKNESNLMTLVSDSISAMVFFTMFVRDNDAREALFSTFGRLFEGLSDIAKAVMIILVADTLLGYHSEEGWTGFLDLFLGHYGIEVEEENIVLFVGIIPIAIDVFFKYWIFIGLNKISPGAVVTIKQLDRH